MTTDKRTYWDGVPDNLRNLCIIVLEEGLSPELVLDWLGRHMFDCESSKATALQVATWITRALEFTAFMPPNEDIWLAYRDKTFLILKRAEELLLRHETTECRSGHCPEDSQVYEEDWTELSQKLNVLLAFLYIYTNQKEELEHRLQMVLRDTEQNTNELLHLHDAMRLIDEDDFGDEFHYICCDRWLPLFWLCRSIPNRMGEELVCKSLELYAEYLREQSESVVNTEACLDLRSRTEHRIEDLRERIIEDAEEDRDEEKEAIA